MSLMKKLFGDYSSRELKSIYPIVDKIDALADEYKAMSDAQLKAKTQEFKDRLANGETLDDILPEAFATVREAADRVLSIPLLYCLFIHKFTDSILSQNSRKIKFSWKWTGVSRTELKS